VLQKCPTGISRFSQRETFYSLTCKINLYLGRQQAVLSPVVTGLEELRTGSQTLRGTFSDFGPAPKRQNSLHAIQYGKAEGKGMSE